MRLKWPDWKEGAGTAIYYIGLMLVLLLGIILFAEMHFSTTNVKVTQVAADMQVDAAVTIGSTGLQINKVAAKDAANYIMDSLGGQGKGGLYALDGEGGQVDVEELKFSYIREYRDEDGEVSYKSEEPPVKNAANAVGVYATPNRDTLTGEGKVSANNERVGGATDDDAFSAEAMVAPSEGYRIVYCAWLHTWEAQKHGFGKQTPYTWAGDHGEYGETGRGWEITGADCSGFVSGIFRICGYMNVTSSSWTGTLKSAGTLVSASAGVDPNGGSLSMYEALDKASPGDIVLYYDKGSSLHGAGNPRHVGIYAGKKNGKHYAIDCRGGMTTIGGAGPSQGAHFGEFQYPGLGVMVRSLITMSSSDNAKVKSPKIDQDFRYGNLGTNETKIAALLLENTNLSTAAVAGIIGNWMWESGADPYGVNGIFDSATRNAKASQIAKLKGSAGLATFAAKSGQHDGIWSGGDGGFGLAQWTTVSQSWMDDRKAKLWIYANRQAGRTKIENMTGEAVLSLGMQVKFAMSELEGNYKGVLNKLTSVNDPEKAAEIFFDDYEAGGKHDVDGTLKSRAANAVAVYNALTGGKAKRTKTIDETSYEKAKQAKEENEEKRKAEEEAKKG